MKINILTVALSLFTLAAVAQKSEIRNAGDAVEDGNYSEAKAEIEKAESMLADANDKWKERFYLYKGQAYLGTGENVSAEDMLIASEAFKKAAEMGSTEAQDGLIDLKDKLIAGAQADIDQENYKSAIEKLETGFVINPQDTLYLYYAANYAYVSKDYDKTIEFSEKLIDLDYDGSDLMYTAVNVETGERENMGSKEQMNLMVQTKQYKEPKVEKTPSKKSDIIKFLAGSYLGKGQKEKALEALIEARKMDPEDISLMEAEANIYIELDQLEKAKDVLEEMTEKDPNNPENYNNIGLIYAQEFENHEEAIKNFEKAIELDSLNGKYYLNLIASDLIPKDHAIQDELNTLGMSKEDNKRYNELIEERKDLYRKILPTLHKAIEYNPDNEEVIRNAITMYSALENEEKVAELKAKLQN